MSTTRPRRTPTRSLALLAAAISGAVLVSGCGYGIQDLPVGRSVGGGDFEVTVQLPSADGLVLGADVRYGQQIVGRVAGLDTAPGGADVRVSLQEDLQVPADVLVSVEIPSALGSPYLRLIPPTDPSPTLLADGDVVSEQNVELGPRVETMLAALGNVVSGSGLNQLETVVRELNIAFTGRAENVQSLADTATEMMTRAIDQQTAFTEAMTLAADVTRRMVEEEELFDRYLVETTEAVNVLVAQRDSMASLLDATTRLAANVNEFTAAAPDGTSGLLRNADTISATLASFNDRIGTTLTNMNAFMDAFGRSVRGDYLVFDGALEIPESLDTVFAGGYFTGDFSGFDASSPTSLEELLGGTR